MAIPAEYLALFLADAREQLQRLGLAVVCVEEHPDDRDTVDEIFRIAHSLKASSATLGFNGMAALAHQMEDVFELLRQRTDGLPREAIDALLECLDALDACVGAIAATGAEAIDPEPLVERLRGLVRARSAAQKASREVPEARPAPVAAALADGDRVVHLVVRLSAEAEMTSVRAYMVLSALDEHGTLLGSVPPLDAVEGFDDHVIEVWLASTEAGDAVSAAAAGVADVAEVSVAELGQERTPARRTTTGSAAARGRPRGLATVRVDVERLDRLVDALSELVVHRTEVELLASAAGMPELERCVAELTRSSEQLGQLLAQLRMIPVEAVFLRFPRVVRDLSQSLGKQVELVLVGEDTELDRGLVDALGAPLAHLVRNALDHGFEPPVEREDAGKPRTGTLLISARHEDGEAVVEVSDDGRGVDLERIAARALARGLIDTRRAAELDVDGATELLFAPGFSTAEQATEVSGRGVGMDAARTAVRELGGELTLTSVPGEGTSATLRLPLGARPGSPTSTATTGEAVAA
jgi:two-component system, chemotaxis family, sensor kinase CheA